MRNVRILMVAALTGIMACGGGGGGGGNTTGPQVFTTLSVDPSNVSLFVNGTQALTATAKDQSGATMSGLTVQ